MNKLSDGIKSASNTARENLATAKTKASKTTGAAKKIAKGALEKSRGAATRGVQTSRDFATKAVVKSSDSIDRNPIAIVLGGLAIGAIIGALLPDTQQEKKILGKAGKKLNKRALDAADAAKKAGQSKMDSLGVNPDAARDQFRTLVGKATEALKAAASAASEAARKQD